jgi:dihydrofolate reductase
MRKLIVSEFVTLDGVMQAPGGKDEDRDGGFEHGGWTLPYWHDDIVVSKTLERPIWRDTTIIRDNVIESVRALKAQPGKNILTDGSSQLVHVLLAHDLVDELHLLVYPLTLGSGKRVLPNGVHTTFALKSVTPYPTGVVGLHYVRQAAMT